MQSSRQHAHRIFKERNGTLRTCEALRAGIHPRSLYEMRDRGEIEQIARGLFRLAELPPPGEPDLLTIAKKVPQAVFCLLTALAFHRLTTQIRACSHARTKVGSERFFYAPAGGRGL